MYDDNFSTVYFLISWELRFGFFPNRHSGFSGSNIMKREQKSCKLVLEIEITERAFFMNTKNNFL